MGSGQIFIVQLKEIYHFKGDNSGLIRFDFDTTWPNFHTAVLKILTNIFDISYVLNSVFSTAFCKTYKKESKNNIGT